MSPIGSGLGWGCMWGWARGPTGSQETELGLRLGRLGRLGRASAEVVSRELRALRPKSASPSPKSSGSQARAGG
eukprot:scaffold47670_cov45-Phaeocystis_antarctica.AAC.2